MKKMKLWLLSLLLLGGGISIDPSSVKAATAEKSLFVQVKNTKLRSDPKFWASSVADLSYGAEVIPVASSDNQSWIKVKYGGQEGYIYVSAVTKRKVIFNSSGDKKVDPSNMVLAGKGFNRQVESSYASSKGISYAAVDEVEAKKVGGPELYNFIHEGKLNES